MTIIEIEIEAERMYLKDHPNGDWKTAAGTIRNSYRDQAARPK